jgi:tRNA 2-selenouridine synthase
VVRQLLEDHYDPGYANSTHRNYAQFNQALAVTVEDISLTALKTVAQRLMSLVAQLK